MNRYQRAYEHHERGYNCAQSVVAGFEEDLPIAKDQAMNIVSGFGNGFATGELCGAVAGGVIVLGLMHPIDPQDPKVGKKVTAKLGKEFQGRFKEKFGHLRCHDLLRNPSQVNEETPAALAMGLSKHCDLMVVTAVELVEEMLKEEGIL